MEVMNLPNKLTVSRILVVPGIVFLLWLDTQWACFAAFFLFVLAALTDLVDGYLARKENQVTNLGKFLDPLADKVLVCGVLVMCVELGWVSAWITIIIICRDLMVTGLRAIAADEGIVIGADKYGKAKTVLQMVALIPLIIHYPVLGIPMHLIGQILLYIALLLTVFSGCNYFFHFIRVWKK